MVRQCEAVPSFVYSIQAHKKHMDKKYQELLEKKQKYQEKLTNLYKNFRGVKHEDSSSEIKYAQIKVYEDFINSIEDELKTLKSSK